MKKIELWGLIVLFLLFNIISCQESGETNMSSNTVSSVENIPINNNKIGRTSIAYSIVDLKSVFNHANYHQLTLQDIDLVFPIEYLRWNHVCYLVYPVKEGGKFCIFFDTLQETDSNAQLVYSDSMYIHDLPQKDDFDVLQKGDSYQIVQAIAPCTQFSSVMSSGLWSYSLLSDGSAMMCNYEMVKGERIVKEWEFVSEENDSYPFKAIFSYDRTE